MKNGKCILILMCLVLSTSAFTKTTKGSSRNKSVACVLEDVATAGLGDVKYSILSETKFQSVNGTGWVLMSGKSKTDLGITINDTSVFDYLTTQENVSTTSIPDARGFFLRSLNNDGTQDPELNRRLGGPQTDTFRAHSHTTMASVQVGSGYAMMATGNTTSIPSPTGSTGGDETRPKNIAVNTFVKVKRNCLDKVAINLINTNTESIVQLQSYNLKNKCDNCLTLPETSLSELQNKLSCFDNEITLYEADQTLWSVTCTARTVGYAKRVLMLIGVNRTPDNNELLTHLDNQYPYYNVISVN